MASARDPLAGVARRIGWTSGQLWTAAVSVAAAVALFLALLPSALHPRQGALVAASGIGGLHVGAGAAAIAPAPGTAAAPSPVPASVGPAGVDPVSGLPGALPGDPATGAPNVPGSVTTTVPTTPVPGRTSATRPAARPSASAGSGSATARPTAAPTPATTQPGSTGGGSVDPASLAASLSVGDNGWTAGAGLPEASAATVAAGQLPVGAAGGRETEHSFFRLLGGGAVLHLTSTTSDPTGGLLAGELSLAAVVLCPNTTASWQPGPAQPSGPAYDAKTCVSGQPSTNLSDFAFNLTAFPAAVRTSPDGWSVVPDSSTPGRTFQLVFATGGTP